MTLINTIFLSFIGLASGFVVAAGIFAFITMLGIIPRLAQRTGTADHIYGYEWMIILGGTAGNILNLFVTHLPVGMIGIPIYGLFSGMFVGCLAMALAENLRVIPETDAAEAGTSGYLTGDGTGEMYGKHFTIFL